MHKVVFITDPEGNIEYFKTCVRMSNGAYYEDEEIVLRKGWILVFGGDVCDKAAGSLRIARELVSAKKRYPDRVFLIVGNRDLNKLRIIPELSEEAMKDEPHIPYGSPRNATTYSAYLTKLAVEQGKMHEGQEITSALWQQLNSKANRLRWILDTTMGSQGEFERRRQEITETSGTPSVNDDEVVRSFLDMMAKGSGVMADFLSHGNLAVGIDSTLFVHGGIVNRSYSKNVEKFMTDQEGSYSGLPIEEGGFEVCLGFVPGAERRFDDVKQWTMRLNAWLREVVAASLETPPRRPLATIGQQYCAYGTWPSVIMGRHLNEKSQPVQLPRGVATSLLSAGFTRLVIGHTPHGNCPTVVPGDVQIIMADTSYSDMKKPDNRGDAASVVEIEGSRATVVGQLEDLTKIAYTVFAGEDARRTDVEGNHNLIGKGDFEKWFVKA